MFIRLVIAALLFCVVQFGSAVSAQDLPQGAVRADQCTNGLCPRPSVTMTNATVMPEPIPDPNQLVRGDPVPTPANPLTRPFQPIVPALPIQSVVEYWPQNVVYWQPSPIRFAVQRSVLRCFPHRIQRR